MFNGQAYYKRLALRVSVLLALTLVCCTDEMVEPGPEPSKVRNILFYAGGDSNVGNEAYQKINLMREGWEPGRGELLIYVDHKDDGAMLIRLNERKNDDGLYCYDTLQVYGKGDNSADWRTLRRSIDYMTENYPADSYGFIFFSHGSGWLPKGTLAYPRSLVIDNGSGNDEMEYSDFAAAIPDAQFDFIILEACLMADVMTIYALRNKAEYVLASSAEIVSPGFGGSTSMSTDIYKHKIMSLFNTQASVKSIMIGFAQTYFNVISSIPEDNDHCSATLSIIEMSEMSNLALAAKTALDGDTVKESDLICSIDSVQQFDRPQYLISTYPRKSRFFDLEHTYENIAASAVAFQSFNTQLEKTVVWKAATAKFLGASPSLNGFNINHHCGLTTYIEQNYPFLNQSYEASDWFKATH